MDSKYSADKTSAKEKFRTGPYAENWFVRNFSNLMYVKTHEKDENELQSFIGCNDKAKEKKAAEM